MARMLIPDLFENPEFGEKGLETQESKRLIRELSETQLNSLIRSKILRPIEKEIARNIGLYDLQLDYNVGRSLIKGIGNTIGYTGLGQENKNLGLNLITKLFSDQLFLLIKTDLDLETETTSTLDNIDLLSEIELTYYLLKKRNLSLNYFNAKEDVNVRKSKISLKYTYEY